jgi:2-pyrone-4,6-dicarboxylate lactonase
LDANPDFDAFLSLVSKDERFVVKVTCPERISKLGPPYDDFVPYARTMAEAIPDRVLWGTDWPHPNMRTHMPDDGKLVDMIPKIAVTAEQQRKLLVDNPMRLYWS